MAKVPLVYAPDPIVKQPSESWPFTMPFSRLLGAQTIDSVAEVRVWRGTYPDAPKTTSIADPTTPVAPETLTLEATDHDANQVQLTLSGGVDGADYYVEIDVATVSGDIRSADGWLLVRDQKEAA